MIIRGLVELRSLPLALGLLTGLLQGCGEKAAPGIPSTALVRSDNIKKRLEEPIPPLPGARFVRSEGGEPMAGPHHVLFSGDSQRSGPYAKTQVGASMALDTSSLDVAALHQEVLKIAPGQLNPTSRADFDRLKTWHEIASTAKEGQGALVSELMTALALHFADTYSGLGLGLRRLSDWEDKAGAGCSYVLSDLEGANVIDLTIWCDFPQARAYVTITYVAHTNGKPAEVSFSEAPVWGTRRAP